MQVRIRLVRPNQLHWLRPSNMAIPSPLNGTNGRTNDEHRSGLHRVQPATYVNRRTALHAVLLSPLWLGFAIGWWRVLRNWPLADLARSFELLAAIAALYGLALTLWIRHNLAIYAWLGPRLTVRAVIADFSRDALGNAVHCTEPETFAAQHVSIEVSGGKKVYRTAGGLQESQHPEYDADPLAVL
jgi:hypothetical protein